MTTYLKIQLRFLDNYDSDNLTVHSTNTMSVDINPIYAIDDSKVNSLFNDVNEYTPKDNDKLYFLPGVSIPRVKLKNLSVNNKIKTIRDITQSTAVFYSKNTLAKMTDTTWFYHYKTEDFKQIIEAIKGTIDPFYLNNLETALEFYTAPYVLTDYHTKFSVIEHYKDTAGFDIPKEDPSSNTRFSSGYSVVDDKYTDVIKGLGNATLYNESTLIKYLNGDDAIEITEELFDSLIEMFRSSDTDNHVLAMEIMANSNFSKSLIYLELLFEKFDSVIERTPTKTHVNFKSLLSYLDKKRNITTNKDNIIASLIKKNQLNETNLNILFKNIVNSLISPYYSDYIKVNSITLNTNLLESMNLNYTFKTLNEFEPVEVVEEEVVLSNDEIISNFENSLTVPDLENFLNETVVQDEVVQFTDVAGNTFEAPVVSPCAGHDAESTVQEDLSWEEVSLLTEEEEDEDSDFKL